MSMTDPERVAHRSALVAECRPLLESARGMDGVQALLSERGVGVMDAIVVTRELLGAGPETLGEAKALVLSSPSRGVERASHRALVAELLPALEELADETHRRG